MTCLLKRLAHDVYPRAKRLLTAGLLLAALLSPTEAFAQKKRQEEPPQERGYTLPYTFTIVMIVGGIIVACLPQIRAKADLDEPEEKPAMPHKH